MALQEFFAALPEKPGAAFVVIVHLDPSSRSELPEILAARCKMPAKQVTGKSELKENCIYVIPPDRQLKINDDEISAVPFKEPRGQRAPIDLFFRSLAEQHGDGFAVILTGAGSDGAVGVKAVKAAGGIILVQDPDEAEYPSMPRNAIATEVADFVLPLGELAKRLVELVRLKKQTSSMLETADEDEIIRRVLAHLRVRTGHDFSHYKRSTILRRMQRRMQVARTETSAAYFDYLRDHAEEAQALLADMLISVTTFFRDSRAFDAVSRHVIPSLMDKTGPDEVIRIWIAGCATGEEAYSMAMLFLEEAARRRSRPAIQIFATDIDARALDFARDGRYPAAIEADVSEERLQRFFVRDEQHYRVRPELRDVILFANHSLLKDPPFSRLDLISCRNVLIYLNRELQQQVLSTLHDSLNSHGYLLLGASESAEHLDHIFHPIDREVRLYQSTGKSAESLVPRLLGMSGPAERAVRDQSSGAARAVRSDHSEALETNAPPSVLVDVDGRVLHLSESAGRYLLHPVGPISRDITELAREEIRFELRAALHRAVKRGETSLSPGLHVRFNGTSQRIYVQVRPIALSATEKRIGRALILFIEGEALDAGSENKTSIRDRQNVGSLVRSLQQELELANAQLRTLREESEAGSEELRAANEESQSINEEHRSTAEELETSKEELQSINEELQTVNGELKLKLYSVSRANSDLENLMTASDVATLFLDSALRIKRFTPRALDFFNITPADLGRPITNFTHQLEYDQLAGDAQRVLRDLTPMEREVVSRTNRWYVARLRPYRTIDDKIDGVVVTFVEVTKLKELETALRASEENLKQQLRLVEVSRAPIFVWDFDDGILQWNVGSEQLYGYTKREALGQVKHELLHAEVPGSSFAALKQQLLDTGTFKGELYHTTKDGRVLIVESQIELYPIGEKRFVLESTRDITQEKALQERQKLLLSELSHRIKNTMAVVQGMVQQTWRTSGQRDEFIRRINGRLAALANSHRLLVESEWQGADLRGLVESQLASYGEERERLRLSGEPIALSPEVAMPLGLVLHELATNAVKYGSLSNSHGYVDLAWTKHEGNGTPQLSVRWREHDGPSVTKPAKLGFGSRLIQQGLPAATVTHEFLPDGVECTIEIPMSEVEGP